MLYRILCIITKLGLLGYYRKIYIHREQPIPTDRPVILAANHPNAFTEPLLMACFSGRILHFITRSDVFHPLLKWFFNGTHQIPIFRFTDNLGFKNLRNNQQTFSRCYDVLAKNGAILIFSEGSTRLGKSVRPLQKGTAKMAFGLLDVHPELDPVIVPVGFTYSRPNHWNGEVMVNIGTPIQVKSYLDQDVHLNENIKEINLAIKNQLDGLAIHVPNPADEIIQEGVAHLTRRRLDSSLLPLIRRKEVFNRELKWTDQVNQGQVSPEIKEKWSEYQSILDENNINHKDFVAGDVTWSKILILVLMAPIAGFGLIMCCIPMLLTSLFVKIKVKNLIFRSGVKVGVATFSSMLVAVILAIYYIFCCGWIGLLVLPIIVGSMLIGIKWLGLFKSVIPFLKYNMSSQKEKINSLTEDLLP